MNIERENNFVKDQQNNENKHRKSSDSANSSVNSERQKSAQNKPISDIKSKNRKIVHDFLYFIEAVNNRKVKSEFRACEAEDEAEGIKS